MTYGFRVARVVKTDGGSVVRKTGGTKNSLVAGAGKKTRGNLNTQEALQYVYTHEQ